MHKALRALKQAKEAKRAVLQKDKEVVKKRAPEVSGKAMTCLNTAMQKWSAAAARDVVPNEILRASGIYDVCPREFVLQYWKPERKESGFDVGSQLRMQAGTHLHTIFQDSLLGPIGVLHGKWKNVLDGREEVGYHPDPDGAARNLAHGDTQHWTYIEDNVWNPELRISGHIDGMLNLHRLKWFEENYRLIQEDPVKAVQRLHSQSGPDAKVLFELKTVNSFGYKKVIDASELPPYYATQAEVYQKLSGLSATMFCYANRDTMQFRFFMHEFEGTYWEAAKAKAIEIWSAIRDERIPCTGLPCTKKTQSRAKACAYATPCFSATFSPKAFIAKAKAAQPERKFLDLSGWKPPK
jgi:hypothetical protein